MKRILKTTLFAALIAGLFPADAFAESFSKSFAVNVIVPERIELALPARLHTLDRVPESLLLRTSGFELGPETNVGSRYQACVVSRELAGRPMQIFTLTVL